MRAFVEPARANSVALERGPCVDNRPPKPGPAAALEPARGIWQVIGAGVEGIVGEDEIERKYLVIAGGASKLLLLWRYPGFPLGHREGATVRLQRALTSQTAAAFPLRCGTTQKEHYSRVL